MKIERARWRNWDALRCVAGECELMVGVSAGPRILSLRRGASSNLLYEDVTDLRVGEWRLYGGHRVTVAPEGEGSYLPDNAPCDVEMSGHDVRVAAPLGRDGLRRALVIGAATDGSGFDVRHVVENRGARPWRGALWGITCVPHPGSVVAPCSQPQVRAWAGTDSTQWQLGSGRVALAPNGSRGKIGWHSPAGWLASLQAAATLVVHSPHVPPASECVDEGCNVEIFTCADYVELETLSGLSTLAPGEHLSHGQRWRLLAPIFTTEDCAIIGHQARCESVACEVDYAR